MRILVSIAAAIAVLGLSSIAQAFCGFYVARADTSLFNNASQVVIVRDQDRTVLTMANDFQGDVEDFAVVIPVPSFIQREQINVADKAMSFRTKSLPPASTGRICAACTSGLPPPLRSSSPETAHLSPYAARTFRRKATSR